MNKNWISGKGRGTAGAPRERLQGEDAMSFGLQVAIWYLSAMVVFSLVDALRELMARRMPELVETVLSLGVSFAFALSMYRLVFLELAARAGRRIRWHWGWAITPFVPATVLSIATYLNPNDTPFLAGLKIVFFVGLSGFFFWLLYLSPLAQRFASLESEDQGESARPSPREP